jgi:hypothetical protein
MHHRLRHTQARLRTTHQWDESKTLYLNAASVPRHQTIAGQICRNFSLVTLNDNHISQSQLVWLKPDGQILASC